MTQQFVGPAKSNDPKPKTSKIASRAAAWFAWSLWALCVVFVVLAVLLYFYTSSERPHPRFVVLAGIPLLVYPTVGAFVVSHRPKNAVGWILCGMGFVIEVLAFSRAYADYLLFAHPGSLIGKILDDQATPWTVGPTVMMCAVLLVLLFPDGKLPHRGWWAVVLMAVCGAALVNYWWVTWPGGIVEELGRLGGGILLASCVASLIPVIVRLQSVEARERQQLKWFAYGAGVFLGAFFLMFAAEKGGPWAGFVVIVTGLSAFPVAVGIAILRYRLYDIDLLINRTLVYGSLTGCVVGLYVLVVGGVGVLFQVSGNLPVSLLATGFVALLFQPLRTRLQREVNRLMYGQRDEPYAVLSRLGRRLEATLAPEEALSTIVEAVAQALKLPYAAIELNQDGEFVTAAEHGRPAQEDLLVLPLVYQSEEVGRLVVSPRAPGEAFDPADRRLLEDLAYQAGAAAHAARLTADLQRSRERLVTAREEERRRLRRDLHDGLGPTLGGLTLGLDAARSMVIGNVSAEELLIRLKEESQEAVSDVRRLVYGLRPPALDDLGLVAAIRQQATKHGRMADGDVSRVRPTPPDPNNDVHNGVLFSVEAPEPLPPLPAATEVASYRIVQEAMVNVARHAKASFCRVSLSIDDRRNELQLEIADDGAGIPKDRRAGVGMSSMHERVEELGGTLRVEPLGEGGTRVLARLRLPAKDTDEEEE